MSFSEEELSSLQKEIEKAVVRFLGDKNISVVNVCLKCATRNYDRRKSIDRLESVLDEGKARKLADKLMILVDDFKSSIKRSRKRPEISQTINPEETVKKSRFQDNSDVKLENSETPIDNGSHSSQTSTPMLNAANIREIMLNAQKAIAQRKQELGLIPPKQAPAPDGLITDPRQRVAELSRQPIYGGTLTNIPFSGSMMNADLSGMADSSSAAALRAQQIRELQAKISQQLNQSGMKSVLASLQNPGSMAASIASGLATPGGTALGLGKNFKGNIRSVIIDDKGRTIDAATGEVITLSQYAPTLKANLRAKHTLKLEPGGEQTPRKAHNTSSDSTVTSSSTVAVNSAHQRVDNRLGVKPNFRPRRSVQFHEAGKFTLLAQRMRTKAQLARLQESVSEVAKRTGIASAAKLATIQPKRSSDEAKVPDIEWWDAYLFHASDLSQLSYESALGSFTGAPGQQLDISRVIKTEWITNLIEHPIRLRPPTYSEKQPAIPLILTKKERKKLRRQTRLESQKEEQEKVRLGLQPPAEPKVRLSNLMRVLGTNAVQDPSKVEAFVRAQMDKRRKTHEAANAARKLSRDQLRQKKMRQIREDTSRLVHVSVYRVRELASASHKFKVETNANQLIMTGFVALHRDCNVVVVEGGARQQRKFRRLMLQRMNWAGAGITDRTQQRQLAAATAALAASSSSSTTASVVPGTATSTVNPGIVGEDSTNQLAGCNASIEPCSLVWEGTVGKRAFEKIQFKNCPTELFAREQFRKHDVEHYWDLAYSGAILQSAGEQLTC